MLTPSISASVACIAACLAGTCAFQQSARGLATAPQAADIRCLRIVDGSGRMTAYIGNVADGESPAILLYDRRGQLRAATMVDSVTGASVPFTVSARPQAARTFVGLRVKGIVHRRLSHRS